MTPGVPEDTALPAPNPVNPSPPASVTHKSRNPRARRALIVVAATVLIASSVAAWWLWSGGPRETCPTLESRVVLAVPVGQNGTGASSLRGGGIANASVFPFAVNPNSNRACGSAVLNPYLSGEVDFSDCPPTESCVGNVSVWTPTTWEKVVDGGVSSAPLAPLWCYNASYGGAATGPPCDPGGADTFRTQAIDSAIFAGNATLDLVIWNGHGGTFDGSVDFWWSQ